jgi:5'-nucleotidase
MNLLVTNDDGINAEGIHNLTEALKDVAKIYICAPNRQKSACGHGISIHESIKVEEVEYKNAERAFSIHGTPADCVKIGLGLLENEDIGIDMVFSGINMGGNLGTDVLYSGTVSAAIEAAICGKPAVALSINSHNPVDYSMAKRLAVKSATMDYSQLNLGRDLILNINIPDLKEEEVKGVRMIGLGIREYDEWLKSVESTDGHKHFKYGGRPVFNENKNSEVTDVDLSWEHYATVTPLHYDLTNYALMKEMNDKGVWNE